MKRMTIVSAVIGASYGHVHAAIVMEPVRKHFGLPYEPLGARVEDELQSSSTGPA